MQEKNSNRERKEQKKRKRSEVGNGEKRIYSNGDLS